MSARVVFARFAPIVVAHLLAVACVPAASGGGSSTPASPSAGGTPTGLAGTSWRLVRFQGGDDRVLVPDDPSKYTFAFGADGRLAMRIDCNRGTGPWTSSAPGQLQIGPLATTRALCPPGSLHDRILKDVEYIRSYVLRGGHLHVALMADAGIYELEPLP
jgi:para-nitrobenzyl esterase